MAEQTEAPSIPLAGAVDLADPVLTFFREFPAGLVQYKPVAGIVIALLPNGAIAYGNYTPGGPVQLFGMMEELKSILVRRTVMENLSARDTYKAEENRQSRPDDIT